MDANTLEAIKFVISNLVPIISAIGAVLAVFVSMRGNKKTDVLTAKTNALVEHTNGMSDKLQQLSRTEGVASGRAEGIAEERGRVDAAVAAVAAVTRLPARSEIQPGGDKGDPHV